MAWSKSPSFFLIPALLIASEPAKQEAVEPHMGTLVRIVFYAGDATPARVAFQRIAALDQALSDYNPKSELNQLCRAQLGELQGDLATIIPTALALARETNGAFDPTLAALTRHMPQPASLPPANPAGSTAKPATPRAPLPPAHHGYQRVTLTGARIALNGTCFDLGGIAKGYAAQEALHALARHGVRRALVAISGDICAGEGEWKIGAQGRTVTLTNACISTSGNESQPGHIFDPRTGQPTLRPGQVTVLSPNGARADALATAHSLISPPGTWIDERRDHGK